MEISLLALIYAAPLLLIVALYGWHHRRTVHHNLALREEARVAGLHEPVSLHPRVDHARCIGCGACVAACPESNVLGLIDGKAELIAAANCIGHGACRSACPVGAIALVFGTESRGIDLPHVQPNFETNVPGIFIAGELGGMGLIRNAVEQGRQAVSAIATRAREAHDCTLDLLIVGAGPAGIAASLAAKAHGLRFSTIDQESLGGTVAHFPRQKIVMTQPVELPLVGKLRFRETTKEALLAQWQAIVTKHALPIRYNEQLEMIERDGGGFDVRTATSRYRARSVLLCLGRRGTPRKLDIPGETLNKVTYRLIDPEQYRGQRVLVVGGGDSAVEAAASIADAGGEVTLAYRGEVLARVKPKNRARIEQAIATATIAMLLQAQPRLIRPDSVAIDVAGQLVEIENDAVIICAGGILPTQLLERIGIAIETKFGTA